MAIDKGFYIGTNSAPLLTPSGQIVRLGSSSAYECARSPPSRVVRSRGSTRTSTKWSFLGNSACCRTCPPDRHRPDCSALFADLLTGMVGGLVVVAVLVGGVPVLLWCLAGQAIAARLIGAILFLTPCRSRCAAAQVKRAAGR